MNEELNQPLSWLVLERYALGELSDDERREVEQRLAASEAGRARLAAIRGDRSAPGELPELARGRPRRARAWAAGTTLLAVAAAVLLLVRANPSEPAPSHGFGEAASVKGESVAIELVSARQGPGPDSFAAGERFKLLVSCPPGFQQNLRAAVFQGGKRFEPLPEVVSFTCGNRVAWPGAFMLDGNEPAEVCVLWTYRPVANEAAASEERACVTLRPDVADGR